MEFKVLERILDNLPVMSIDGKDYTPTFNYGSELDMLKYLRLVRSEGKAYYPLIWVETPVVLTGDIFPSADITIILATLTNKDLSNRERIRLTFETTLEPLLENVISAIKSDKTASLISKDEQVLTKYFNYDTDSSSRTTEIWDAITFKCTIQFNLNCL
ncbi:MAG: hypothetical protein DRQ45_00610 [Gammaproteobacteria bacterium]|nr:MAG: hypothetical protein DRQ45_00610 [Gammaproteobacteria bacterium]